MKRPFGLLHRGCGPKFEGFGSSYNSCAEVEKKDASDNDLEPGLLVPSDILQPPQRYGHHAKSYGCCDTLHEVIKQDLLGIVGRQALHLMPVNLFEITISS